ncbi:MAG: outer membrane lipoprotein chaperone LolA [Pseudohongiella sp.]|nr:outer membrane lipoprotein chaperone LolA [Pseudohongiella sp.]MDO9519660.1 outer membrane lipoprotein chaperone LolA [Pseudohongiella sp.]MDP2127645.1 outer membrane lipoprotein chaperone LolA [Pseudohongiella sp.]
MSKRVNALQLSRQFALFSVTALALGFSSWFLPSGLQAQHGHGHTTAVESDVPAAGISTDLETLNQQLDNLQTFRADVRQLIVENTGGVLEESEILFMLKRPHGFYWETLQPFPELIVTDGETLWNYQPDLLQLSIENWDASRSELAAQLLSGNTEAIADEYTVSAIPVNGTDWEFLLYPNDPASLYEQVSLYFEQGELVSILLINTNGQRTFWEFNNREINIELDASLFVFETPDDEFLDIVDKRETVGL